MPSVTENVVREHRLPPHSLSAEAAVLGCCLLSAIPCLGEAHAKLRSSEAFYDVRHQSLFGQMLATMETRGALDVIMLVEDLKASKQLEEVGGFAYVQELPDVVETSANLDYHLEIVAEKYTLRKLIELGTRTVTDAYESEDPATLLDKFEREALEVRSKSTKSRIPVKELVKACIDKIEEFHQRQNTVHGLSTGFSDWDRMTGGLHPGEMTVIAAYPGVGKTALALNVAEHVVLDLNLPVGVFSLEMSAESLVMRMLCSRARVNLRNVREGFLAERDFQKLTGAASKIARSLIQIHDISDLSVEEYRAEARRMVREHGVKLIVVDYLQLLTATGGKRKIDSRQEEVAAISGGVKKSALELGIPVIALSQLNDDGRLRESRAIGQDSDNVQYLQRVEKEDSGHSECDDMTLDIRKQRAGPTGQFHLTFLKQYTRFETAAKIDKEDTQNYRAPQKDA